jgi:thiamine biosynthesis lipoprotein
MTSVSRNSLRRARPLLGTFVEIALLGGAPAALEAAADAAFAAIAQAHRLMSFHDAASDVGRLNRAAVMQDIEVHPWTFRVLEAALDLHHRSAGIFDVAVAPAPQSPGLSPVAAESDRWPPARGRSDAITLRPGCRVRFHDPGLRVDLGGIAKGFAVDRAVEVLAARGISGGLVNAGGDLAAFGADAHLIHLRAPWDARALLGPVALRDAALASSGVRFDPIGAAPPAGAAIIDPRNAQPVPGFRAVTVRAPSCMVADALTKVVMIAGDAAAALLGEFAASAIVIAEDGDVHISSNWQDAFFRAA